MEKDSLSNKESQDFAESHRKKMSKRDIVLNLIQSQINKISPNMVSVDEKYLRRCLELLHISAFSRSTKNMMGFLPETLYSAKTFRGDSCGYSDQVILDCPVENGTGSVVISATKSMINISNNRHHLLSLHKFGNSGNGDENLSRMKFSTDDDAKGLICFDHYMDSPSGLLSISPVMEFKKIGSISSSFRHERLASTSSTNSLYSDPVVSFDSPNLSQGMLQCTWKEGLPHYVFSADDHQKEVYVAKLRKVRSSNDKKNSNNKSLDYEYQFHSETSDQNSQLVGKMNVSTSFTIGPNNSYKIMETELVLFGNHETSKQESSSHTQRKKKGLSKKVSQVLRSTSPLSKHRKLLKLGGNTSDTIAGSCPWEPRAILDDECSLLESENTPPNLELGAIVVKSHIPCNPQEEEVGGWGLKFLKQATTTLPCESSMMKSTNDGDCSNSMTILIPSGLHGGPRTKNGSGPSSLTDRWRSGGHCDCGGWDEGCPLTVLHRRSTKEQNLCEANMQGDCKTIDVVTQVCMLISSSFFYRVN